MATYAAYGQKFEFDNSVPPQAVAQALDHYFTEDPSRKTQISDSFLDAVKQQESGGNSKAVSPKGAQGAYQLMPATAKAYGVTDPTNEAQAREGARKLFADLALKYNGDTDKMLAAYNAGETNINNVVKNNGDNWQKGLTGGLQETAKYIPSVTDKWMGTTSPKAQPTMADKAVTSLDNAIPGSRPIAEAVGSVVAPMIGQVASGYAGLAKLATTGSVDDAANAVRNVQEQSQVHPQTTTGQLAQEGVNAVGTAGTKLLQTPVAFGTGISAAINGKNPIDAAGQVYQDGAGATLAKPLEETGHPALAAIAGAAPEAIGQTVGSLVGEPLLKGAIKAGEVVANTLGDAMKSVANNIADASSKETPFDIANRITQGTKQDAHKTLHSVSRATPEEVTPIKTADDLAAFHRSKVEQIGAVQDALFQLDQKKLPLENLNTSTTVGNTSIAANYPEAAFTDLKKYYGATKSEESMSSLATLIEREKQAQTDGMTAKDVNDLAREYSSTLGKKAFSKSTGLAAGGVEATAAEGIRSGIKRLAARMVSDPEVRDAIKTLDGQLSEHLNSERLAKKLSMQANTVIRSAQEASLPAKIAGKIVSFIDTATGHSISTVLGKLVGNAEIGHLNKAQIESGLNTDLIALQRRLSDKHINAPKIGEMVDRFTKKYKHDTPYPTQYQGAK